MQPFDFLDKLQKKRKGVEGIYTTAYYTLGGLLAGLLIGNLWDRFNLPGNNQKLENALLTRQPIQKSPYDEDKLYQNILVGLVMASEAFGIKGGIASGVGMLIGLNYSNKTKKGEFIGDTPTPTG